MKGFFIFISKENLIFLLKPPQSHELYSKMKECESIQGGSNG